ncbi:ATP:cob(I)alamin adenosyltransferase [Thiohalobacter sp. COW1]|uniref:Corrinoid adenosyltransferase n=1 Tax=Thiohalobacter thiocyanaticus TaxID=585455 RepID=A0A1Z4VU23_9GAMM|nr:MULTISPECIES: cob(I)yrinic acid a,c-diamide adenosyltransferase [Thiohalobacter]BAZ95137.1 cobalamin adenosyltransferase protein [Thiohalobacter thiocyanaticus]BCO32936.1 ATP:cob(I)alamin adenosyltransferase [Thiohalobacter sp. COW1]
MGHRLSKIYTRTGDDGCTGLGDGSRVDKDDARVEAFGTVDELNSMLGILAAQSLPAEVREGINAIQHDLFDLGGELCVPELVAIGDGHIRRLEAWLDTMNAELGYLEEFILPGGVPAAAHCHLARTVCRRAERRLVSLARSTAVNPAALQYLNRLSDLLFVLARHLNRLAGEADVLWQRGRNG